MSEKKAKSPYVRYEKTPYRYSQEHSNWQRAVLTGKPPKVVEALSQEHRRKHGPHHAR